MDLLAFGQVLDEWLTSIIRHRHNVTSSASGDLFRGRFAADVDKNDIVSSMIGQILGTGMNDDNIRIYVSPIEL
jgi:hypothetical protein